jgi:hypothetical protein
MTTELIEFHVEKLVVDVDLSAAETARLTPVLKAAFEELAKRLQMSPVSRWRNTTRLTLAALTIEPLAADELLGPRGATRLADAFWEQLTRAGSAT